MISDINIDMYPYLKLVISNNAVFTAVVVLNKFLN